MVLVEEAKRRADICKACSDFIPETKVCNLCGCWMKAKVWIPFATCPKGEWNEREAQNSTHEGS